MSTLRNIFSFSKLSVVFTIVVCVFLSGASFAQGPHKVATHHDAQGWKLKVDGNDFYIKGVVWGYSPRGENYTYNLWGQPESTIRKILDYDFSLMKKANVNALNYVEIKAEDEKETLKTLQQNFGFKNSCWGHANKNPNNK